MSAFPYFSDIAGYAQTTITSRKNKLQTSKLNAWVRVSSGTGAGISLVSNPNYALFSATGIYGNLSNSGAFAQTWGGSPLQTSNGQPFRPTPIVTSLEIDEGAGNLSRKADFSITCFSKTQMEELTKYFLEPGHSIFIEWGWNTSAGVGGLQSLSGANIAKFQSFVNTNNVRSSAQGQYDNYLGFMTGGGLSISGETWIINVKCTGYTELPAYLLGQYNGENADGTPKLNTAELYGQDYIENSTDAARQRWMYLFNKLPDTKTYQRIKNLGPGESNAKLSGLENFVNFDEELITALNEITDGKQILGFNIPFGKSKVTIGGESLELPFGTELCSTDGYIKFSALMEIISAIGVKGYKMAGGKTITFKIDTKSTYCSAFKEIFSIDPSKLFIPNPKTPSFKLTGLDPTAGIESIIGTTPINNSVSGVVFPEQGPISYKPDSLTNTISKAAGEAGLLNNLYVNFNFAKGILETKNFFIKDILYQILNGLSSAVNGIWDFQITENENKATGVTELKVHELNFISNNESLTPYTFTLIGEDSVFIDASFDLDIGGAKMNQIIGQKLSSEINEDSKSAGLFSKMKDQIALSLEKEPDAGKGASTQTDADTAKAQEDFLKILLGKISYAPKVEIKDKSELTKDLDTLCYLLGFKDAAVFSSLKLKGKKEDNSGQPSALMPINFSFKIHGVSGIKRGDKFQVNGIPSPYKDGFFQVLSVKHTLEGMLWYTDITGGYRNKIK